MIGCAGGVQQCADSRFTGWIAGRVDRGYNPGDAGNRAMGGPGMTSYERIVKTLKRESIDRIPAGLWATEEVIDSLMNDLACQDLNDLYGKLGVDKIVWVQAPYVKEGDESLEGESAETVRKLQEDLTYAWGVERREMSFGPGSYMEFAAQPLKGVGTISAAEEFAWPGASRFDYDALRTLCKENAQWVRMLFFISLFEIYCAIKPMDEALMDLYAEQDLAQYIIGRIAEVQVQYIENALKAAGDDFEIIYISDDMGMQDRQLISTEVWQFFFRDHLQRIIDMIHAGGKIAFYHTDGSAPEIVDCLVEMGIDVLNPIQHRCSGMQRERLKRLYGDRVVFHGAVENQEVLPFGTPQDVRAEVVENLQTLGAGGGYIAASCHNLQAGTPLDNIKMLYDTVRAEGHKYL